MVNLFVNSLIPPYFLSFQKTLALSPIPLQNPAQVIDRAERPADTGIFSALTSYVSSFANDEPPEPSDQEIEYTLCTVDTVKECHFEDILANISQLPVESLRSLLMSLLEHLPEDGSPRVMVVKPEISGASPRTPGPRQKGKGPLYDPSLVFVLELATVLALRDNETVKELAKDVTDALVSVIRDAPKHHYVVIARSVYYLLSLLKASNVSDRRFCLYRFANMCRITTSSEHPSSCTPSQASMIRSYTSAPSQSLRVLQTAAKGRMPYAAS